MNRFTSTLVATFFIMGCASGLTPGPDKQGLGVLQGAVTGAGAGAITGAQVSAATGPGAAVGAGLGAVAGGIRGMLQDDLEDQALRQQEAAAKAAAIAKAQEMLSEHYRRRVELHPSRDIFPADWFFYGDSVRLRPQARALVTQLTHLNKERLPHSRLAIAVYSKSREEDSPYAKYLTERRSKELVNYFVRAGIDSRRIEARPVVVSEPVLVDPLDKPGRYNQAIEIIPLDR